MIGLHTVSLTTDKELACFPATQWVLIQKCAQCGLVLNRVSHQQGVLLAAGTYLLTYTDKPQLLRETPDPPGFRIQLAHSDAKNLLAMPGYRALEHLKANAWGSPLFLKPKDMSQHPSSLSKRSVKPVPQHGDPTQE